MTKVLILEENKMFDFEFRNFEIKTCIHALEL